MTLAILSFVILILSIVLHEVAHGYAANALGDPTARLAGRLTLNPLPHIDAVGSVIVPALLVFTNSPIMFGWAKPVPYNPYNLKNQRFGETLVAAAGSATNLLLAIIFGLIVRFGSTPLTTGGALLDENTLYLAASIAFINLFLGLFNLIPFPPLDGFTVLRSILPWRFSSGFVHLEEKVRSMGMLSLLLFLLFFSYLFATPFFLLVNTLFRLLIGGSV